MTIVAIANDCMHFFPGPVKYNSGYGYESGYARHAIRSYLADQNPSLPVNGYPFVGGALTDVWLHWLDGPWHNASTKFIGLTSGDSTYPYDGIFIGQGAAPYNYSVAVFTFNHSTNTWTQLTRESGASIPADGIKMTFDVHITNYDNATTGNIKVYVNGASSPVIDYTGDLRDGSGPATSLQCISVHEQEGYDHGGSEMIASTTDTRGMRMVTQYPNAAGDVNQWDGGAYTDVDEENIDQADRAYCDVDAKDLTFGLSNIPSGTWEVLFVQSACLAAKSVGASVSGLAMGIRSASTTSVDGTPDTVDGGLALFKHDMTVNPVTSNPFTVSELDALQIALRTST